MIFLAVGESDATLRDLRRVPGAAVIESTPDRSDIQEKLDRLQGQFAAFEETLATAESALADGRHMDALRVSMNYLII